MSYYTKTLIETNCVKGSTQTAIINSDGKEVVVKQGTKVLVDSKDGNFVNIDFNGIKIRTFARNIETR